MIDRSNYDLEEDIQQYMPTASVKRFSTGEIYHAGKNKCIMGSALLHYKHKLKTRK